MHGHIINDMGHNFWTPIYQPGVRHIVVEPTDDLPGWKMNENVKTAFELIKEHGGMFIDLLCSHDPAAIFVAKCPIEKHYKLVLRNHSQLCQIAHRVEDMFNIIRDDVVYNDWPVSTGCTMVKSTLTDCPAEMVVRETWDLIEKEKCTIASLQPSMIQMLSYHCEDIHEPHWKLKVLSTTGFVRQSVMDVIGRCNDAIVTCYSLIEAGVVSRLMVTDTTKTRYTEGCVGDLTDPVRTRFDTKGPGSAKPTKVQAALPVKRYRASFLFMALIFSCFILSCEANTAGKMTTVKGVLKLDLPLCRDNLGSLANCSNTLEALKEMLIQERKLNNEFQKSMQDWMIQFKHDLLKEVKELLKNNDGNK
ncbi:uncharacterized protein LOC131956441 [Physella acuta]|uniref:uncharacterized protein LOC131956441 n=1 Tax=Physella acuta TaxID=109671 RepID=UPI0027DAD4EC|nr:uncharacterized protein LOC131956441 [Physella acuta]